MKKILLTLLPVLVFISMAFSQANIIKPVLIYDGTSGNRGPNGTVNHTTMRGCFLLLQSELSQIPANVSISALTFTLNSGPNINVAGNFTLFLENSNDVAYTKSATYATAITGMQQVYAGPMTIPTTATSTSITVTLGTPFTYTGGAIYVAFDWASSGPFGTTAAIYRCQATGLTNGGANGASGTSTPPVTLTGSNFRPNVLLTYGNPFTNDIELMGIESPGRIPASFNSPHTVRAIVRNSSSGTNNNINVNLNVTGANPYSATQVIPTLTAGATATVAFTGINPVLLGQNTVSVNVPSDQNNINNALTYTQTVNCSEWSQNPAPSTFTALSVGFAAASGALACKYDNPVASSLTGMRGAVSTNTPSVGNVVYGILYSGSGATLAITNTVQITTPMLGTFQTFTFATPQTLAPATSYYLGFAQTTPTNAIAYYPAGATGAVMHVPAGTYVSLPIAGGTPGSVTGFGYFGIDAIFDPTVSVGSFSRTVSCGVPANIGPSGAGTFSWSTGATTQSISVSLTTNTLYTVSNGNQACPSNTTAVVNVTAFPMPIVASATIGCAGDPVTLTASGAASYTWTSPTTTVTNATLTDNPLGFTTYMLIGTNPGCVSVNSINYSVNALPALNLNVSAPVICLGNTVSLIASGTSTAYVWAHGPLTNSVSETPQSTTVYTITGTATNGCARTRTVEITVNSFTPAISSGSAICQGAQITLTTTAASQINWSNNSPFATIFVSPTITTTYSVTSVGPNLCKGSNSVVVTVNNNPVITATANRTLMCKGESNTLNVTGTATSYTWNNNISATSITVAPVADVTHMYSVIGTDNAGCKDTAYISIKVDKCVGLNEQNISSGIQIFPNPGTGIFNIHFDNITDNTSVKIYNAIGALVKEETIVSNATRFDLTTESNGVYFVYVVSDAKTIKASRIIKQ